ncbi:polysaccharide biosynthesis protein [Xylanibacillus composti]|uniref:Sugar transporter n=1 Tax=Xylanibacillus composti TaxID=1572762 RepID=A0A8J4H0H0_9BACL|nr:polysaccharide biosynthesis protein [Xylanibacillus composti]MDT9725142.1 polysaccharide biosynthesis protein [Xylanibacillus composti]GIQ67285.1 sugar transporter [Xylanibacillus composti]
MIEREERTGPTAGGKLVKGAAILGLAAVLSKLIGTMQKIPLQNVAGDETFGIYSTVYPFYIFVLFLATAGFPIAVSKFVSERTAHGDERGMREVLFVSLVLMSMTGLAGFACLYWGADQLARWIGNAHTAASIRSVSFAMLFIPVMAVLRGFFQGQQNMVPTAVSQVTEQTVRVAAMLILLFILTAQGAEPGIVAAGATFGSAAGAAAGLVTMAVFWWKSADRNNRTAAGPKRLRSEERKAAWRRYAAWSKKLTAYALPVCLGAIVMPVLGIVDTFTVPRLLESYGLDERAAMDRIGVYNRGQTLAQLVGMLFSSVSVAIVPAIAEAKSRGRREWIELQTDRIMRVSWLIGWAAAIGIAVCAQPINTLLYTNADGSAVMAVIGISVIFSVMNIVTASLLQGIGSPVWPALHLLAAVILKVGLNMWWVPQYGIMGAAAAAVAAFALAMALNQLAVSRLMHVRMRLASYWLRPLLAWAGLAVSLWMLREGLYWLTGQFALPNRLEAALHTSILVLAGMGVFAILALRTGSIQWSELEQVPKLRKIAAKARRWLNVQEGGTRSGKA